VVGGCALFGVCDNTTEWTLFCSTCFLSLVVVLFTFTGGIGNQVNGLGILVGREDGDGFQFVGC
jgi:hypothetical protein